MVFLRGEFPIGMEVSGVYFPGEILYGGDLPEFVNEICFICLTFSLGPILHVGMLWCNCRGNCSSELKFSGILLHGERDFL